MSARIDNPGFDRGREIGDALVREHADELGIDPSRIAAAGSSAGGLLAAATALISDFDDSSDENIDARPNALILYNPGLDTASPEAAARMAILQGKAVADRGREFSPLEHLDRGLPPTIIFQEQLMCLRQLRLPAHFAFAQKPSDPSVSW